MGSPRVFQTAPPQPASKARMTCSPQLVGGAEASQKGLGHLIPAKVVSRVALDILSSENPGCHCGSRSLAVSDGVDNFATTVRAVATCKVFRVGSLSGR